MSNNDNSVRRQYRDLTDNEKELVSRAKAAGAEFLALCDEAGSRRESSIAKTKIEEAVMWLVKGITQ